jgi:LCP family protein required for cell wall assembly
VSVFEESQPPSGQLGHARLWAVVSLVGSAIVSVWGALYLLAEVTPALFPGQQLTLAAPSLPGPLAPLQIDSPGPESVFNQPIFVLLAAVDERPNVDTNLQAVNTDTILLARIDPIAKDVRVLSVPRDLWMDISYPGGVIDQQRINTSFAIGAGDGKGDKAGMDHLQKDLERDLGVDIDYWVEVDFRGAERLIDAFGGVNVDIPEELSIENWWYSDDDVTHKQISFPPGPQHLDGYNAVAFARLRAPDDDLHRIKRQQIVLQAVFDQAFSSGLMNNPMDLWNSYKSAVRTNVPGSRMPGLALLAKQVRGSLQTYSLGDPFEGRAAVEDRTLRSGAEVLMPVPDVIQEWIDLVFNTPAETGVVSAAGP